MVLLGVLVVRVVYTSADASFVDDLCPSKGTCLVIDQPLWYSLKTLHAGIVVRKSYRTCQLAIPTLAFLKLAGTEAVVPVVMANQPSHAPPVARRKLWGNSLCQGTATSPFGKRWCNFLLVRVV